MTSFPEDFLESVRSEYGRQRQLAERAIAQVGRDADLFTPLAPGGNSVAHLVKHVAGNLKSRWIDFRTTDGEKPTRNRDAEFEDEAAELRVSLLARWSVGWRALIDALESLTPADLESTVTIRGTPYTLAQAIVENLAHTAQHVGQIVLLSKHAAGEGWRTLSVPKRTPETGH